MSSPTRGIHAASSTSPGYERLRDEFTWAAARAQLAGLPSGSGLDIAHEAVDRHCLDGRGHRVAVRSIASNGCVTDLTYDALRGATDQRAPASSRRTTSG